MHKFTDFKQGELDIDLAFRLNVKKAIEEYKKETGCDRYFLAMQLSKATNQDITKNTIDTWTKTDPKWRFPANILPAFIKITGAIWLLDNFAQSCDCSVISRSEKNQLKLINKKQELRSLQKEIEELEKSFNLQNIQE